MPERYLIAMDGRGVGDGPALRREVLGQAIHLLELGMPAVEVAIADARTLQVVACWRRTACGWRLVGALTGWLH